MIWILRLMSFVFGLLVYFSCGAPAQAQVAVWDPEEIARLAEKSANMAEALSHAVELLNNINDLSRTIGRFGGLPTLDFTHFDMLEGGRGAGPEIGGLISNISVLQDVKIASFNDASSFVKTLTTVPSGGRSVTNAGQIRQALDILHRQAIEDGYALSMLTREGLSVAPKRVSLLVAQASASVDLRGDVGANTAVAMAVLDQLGGMRATLASLLEIQTTRRLAISQTVLVAK